MDDELKKRLIDTGVFEVKMEELLKKKLTEAGVSETAIAILEVQELTTEKVLQGFTYERLVDLKIPAGSARIVADLYGPKETPRRWFAREKKLSELGPEELIQLVARNPKDRDIAMAAAEKIGDLRIFATGEDGTIDVQVSLEAYRHRKEVPSIPERVRGSFMRTLQDIRGERLWADPFGDGSLSWFNQLFELAENDPETFAAVWYMRIYEPKVLDELGSEAIWDQCTRKPEQGPHILAAKESMKKDPDRKITVAQRMRWTGTVERRKDCDEKPFPRR